MKKHLVFENINTIGRYQLIFAPIIVFLDGDDNNDLALLNLVVDDGKSLTYRFPTAAKRIIMHSHEMMCHKKNYIITHSISGPDVCQFY